MLGSTGMLGGTGAEDCKSTGGTGRGWPVPPAFVGYTADARSARSAFPRLV
jgi:hypothetical protein